MRGKKRIGLLFLLIAVVVGGGGLLLAQNALHKTIFIMNLLAAK